jgi:hypothetical protein
MNRGNSLMPRIKDSAILLGWIGGIILAGGLCWQLTRNTRAELLMVSVNLALAGEGNPLRLEKPIAFRDLPSNAARMGTWFSLEDGNRKALVFTMIAGGSFLPCAALVDAGGKVERIFPLNSHSSKLLSRISPGVLRIYTRRIEEGAL